MVARLLAPFACPIALPAPYRTAAAQIATWIAVVGGRPIDGDGKRPLHEALN